MHCAPGKPRDDGKIDFRARVASAKKNDYISITTMTSKTTDLSRVHLIGTNGALWTNPADGGDVTVNGKSLVEIVSRSGAHRSMSEPVCKSDPTPPLRNRDSVYCQFGLNPWTPINVCCNRESATELMMATMKMVVERQNRREAAKTKGYRTHAANNERCWDRIALRARCVTRKNVLLSINDLLSIPTGASSMYSPSRGK